ncbi:hypothetical protein [Methylacidimicrobium sp. B4]|uniref:hypothetical protein n=1 Tax=Methylacidimicrobium sp. B4 TaxID=2796139 RepID=UPI001A8F78EB|nr:hypothetical protein [Methylacidimicrobium sp. B4]QSR84819.1 hypothetical protein MacB4_00600 [Methylacidimicrobium sp. B4]
MHSDLPPFPPFDLSRLLRTVFAPRRGERIALLIDLPDPRRVRGYAFRNDPSASVQRLAYEVFFEGLQRGVRDELGLVGGDLFAYGETGGSNLDLPSEAFDPFGNRLLFDRDLYPRFDLFLCFSRFSATAPLTAKAKAFGFRGATLHGLNRTIVASGLSVDYEEVSRQAEILRSGLSGADRIRIDFRIEGAPLSLALETRGVEAQKSHGLCRGEKPDIVNLPAGEVYFVPTGAEGAFPHRWEDGTTAIVQVSGGRAREAQLLRGDPIRVDLYNRRLAEDPATGEVGELGFGTQELPPAGPDIQDEKILGTFHIATGRSDHLGGPLGPSGFRHPRNATHDDILFAPFRTPDIEVPQVRMERDGETQILLEEYRLGPYFRELLGRTG